MASKPGTIEAKALIPHLSWLVMSGAADNESTRELWLAGLHWAAQLLRVVVAFGGNLRSAQRTTISRLVDSLVNLTCALTWLSDEDKDGLTTELENLHEALQVKA